MKSLADLEVARNLDVPRIRFFEEAAYDERLAKVREELDRRDIDLLLVTRPENIRYLTGYFTVSKSNPQFLLVPRRGKLWQIVRFLEAFNALAYSVLEPRQVLFYDDTEDPIGVVTEQVRAMGLERSGIAVEGLHMSDMTKHKMSHVEHGNLCSAKWYHIDGDHGRRIIEEIRDVKSPAELGYMRLAGKQSVAAAHAGYAAIHAGDLDCEVAGEISRSLLRAGSEILPHSPTVGVGWRAGIPHMSFERYRIEPGDTVLLEFSGLYAGYVAPIMRSISVGNPSDEVQRMSDVLMEALTAAVDTMKPGVTSAEVDQACRGVVEKEGYYENFRKRTGYSVGLMGISWPEHLSLAKEDPTVLKSGMAFHLPVALRDYGRSVVCFSVTVAVTETGTEVLTEFPEGIVIR